MLTSMDADGTKNGYDISLTRAVTDLVDIPVIASGGAGTPQHLVDAVTEGHAQAVLISSIVHYGDFTIGDLKDYMKEQGLPVRPVPSLASWTV